MAQENAIMTALAVSVIIPTFNPGPEFPEILARIRSQKDVGDVEIVVVDSGSKDGTLDAARHVGAKTIVIDRKSFNHGGTRNLGISESSGDPVALMTQDAMPENKNWLCTLVEAISNDPSTSGAYSRQIPHPNTPPWVLRQMENHGLFSDSPRIQELKESSSFHCMQPLEKLALCTFDNVSSLVRRSAWEKHPFPEAPFAEDLEWARDEILRGNKIIYQPKSRVIHSHRRGPVHEYRRSRIAHQRLCELFDIQLVPTVPLLFRYSLQNIIRLTGWALEKPANIADIFQAPWVAVAGTLGQYMGAKSTIANREAQP
jgi:rhamnosyltransferase